MTIPDTRARKKRWKTLKGKRPWFRWFRTRNETGLSCAGFLSAGVTPRPRHSYRAARKNLARKQLLHWPSLARVRTKECVVVILSASLPTKKDFKVSEIAYVCNAFGFSRIYGRLSGAGEAPPF